MSLTGIEMANFTKAKKGTNYVYGAKGADGPLTQARVDWLAANYPSMFTATYLKKIKDRNMVGKVATDCSGLISWYTGKVYGSSQLYSNAYARMPISEWNKFAVGTVLWKSGHVGVYLGDGLVVEAKGIDYGTIISKVEDTKWVYGLTFSWIDYDIKEAVSSDLITYKGENPYSKPTLTIKKGSKGNGVKWLQWELNQAGYNISIDGDFGNKTYNALIAFQESSKIDVDGKCGPQTKAALLANGPTGNPYTKPSLTIKVGSKGNGVKWLQWELNQAGYGIAIDGDFGNNTYKALIAFQDSKGLDVDGKCGPKTKEALLAS